MKRILIILSFLIPFTVFGQYQDTIWRAQDTVRLISEKHPKYGPWNKPTSLNDRGLIFATNMIPSAGGVLTDISGNGNNGTISGAISSVDGLVFDGTDDYVDLATEVNSDLVLSGTWSVVMRVFVADVTTNQIFFSSATNNTNRMSISVSSGRIGFSIYDGGFINKSKTIGSAGWYNIVTTNTNKTTTLYVNAIVSDGAAGSTTSSTAVTIIGARNTTPVQFNHFNGEIDNIKIYNYAFTQQQAQDYHNSFAKRVVLIDNFEYDAVGSVPLGWQIESGTFAIAEDVTSKYISCTGNGDIVFHGADLSVYFESGWVKTLTDDLSGDQDNTVDNATNLAYSNGKLTVTMTSGQKLRELIITQAEEQ